MTEGNSIGDVVNVVYELRVVGARGWWMALGVFKQSTFLRT